MEEKKEKSKVVAAQKVQKLRWSLARCKKVANRFKSESEWAKGAPSSYKSAQHHGWIPEIVKAMSSPKFASQPSRAKKAA